MLLKKGKSKEIISGNIRREVRSGKPIKQAIEIAMRKAMESKKNRK